LRRQLDTLRSLARGRAGHPETRTSLSAPRRSR
jgi:hypothetical protein